MFRHLRTLAALTVVVGALPLGGVAAHAETGVSWNGDITSSSDPARGHVCSFFALTDYTGEAFWYTGEVRGGPVLLTGVAAAGATLDCRIQVNVSTPTSSGPSATAHGAGVLTAGPAIDGFLAWSTDDVYLCAALHDDLTGTTRYWDADRQTWSTSDAVHCLRATHVFTP